LDGSGEQEDAEAWETDEEEDDAEAWKPDEGKDADAWETDDDDDDDEEMTMQQKFDIRVPRRALSPAQDPTATMSVATRHDTVYRIK